MDTLSYSPWLLPARRSVYALDGKPCCWASVWRAGATSPTCPIASARVIAAASRALANRCGVAEPQVAVRSSAVEEDGPTASFAGQYDTFLNLVGAEAVARAVLQCWASARSARVLAYRRRQGCAAAGVRLAVLIQQLVQASLSAIVFSANPLTGRRDHILMNVSWGLGDSIVRGTVTPDMYVLRKADLAIVERQIAPKRHMTVLAPTGTREAPVPAQLQHVPAATDHQVCEMARLSLGLARTLGRAVDIECAWSGHGREGGHASVVSAVLTGKHRHAAPELSSAYVKVKRGKVPTLWFHARAFLLPPTVLLR